MSVWGSRKSRGSEMAGPNPTAPANLWETDPAPPPMVSQEMGPPQPGATNLWEQDPHPDDVMVPAGGNLMLPRSMADQSVREMPERSTWDEIGHNLERGMHAGMRGMTFNLSDKLGAAASATGEKIFGRTQIPDQAPLPERGWSDAYHDRLLQERIETENFAKDHPWLARLAWAGGGVQAPIPVPGSGLASRVPGFAAPAPTLAGRTAQSAAIGGGIGGTAAYADTNDQSLGENAKAIALGAGGGSLLGAAAPWVTEHLLSPIAQRVQQWWSGAPAVEQQAHREVGNALQSTMDATGQTPADLRARLDPANTFGKPVFLADVGGKPARALLGSASREPGPAQEYTEQQFLNRDRWAQQRNEEDVATALGRQNAFQEGRELAQERSVASRPLYQAALSETDAQGQPRVIASQHLDRLLGTADVIAPALAEGTRIQQIEAAAENRSFDPNGLGAPRYIRVGNQLVPDLDKAGNLQYNQRPNMTTLDVIKKGLDSQVAAERNEITGRLSQKGVALDKFRDAYLRQLDSLNPDYAAARAAWAGPAQAMDAINFGRTFMSRDPSENAAALARMSPGTQDFVRMGLSHDLRAKMADVGKTGDESNVILGKGPNGMPVQQLSLLFKDPQEFAGWLRRPQLEQDMFRTGYDVLGNSKTAERWAVDRARGGGESGGGIPTLLTGLASGEMGLTSLGAARAAGDIRRWALRPTPEVNEQVARILANPDQMANRAALMRALEAASQRSLPARSVGYGAYGIGGASPMITGSPLAEALLPAPGTQGPQR